MVTELLEPRPQFIEANDDMPEGEQDELYSLELNPGLTDEEVEKAYNIIRWLQGSGPFYGIAGIMLVTGPPRAGKGLFSTVLAYWIKRFFKGKRILMDNHPRKAFGHYTLFNEDVITSDISKMREVSDVDLSEKEKGVKDKANKLEAVASQWTTERGDVMLKNAIWQADEFWRYMDKRIPGSIMNRVTGGIIKNWGHLDLLLMGIAQEVNDLDFYRCLPHVTHEARCNWCDTIPNTVQVSLYRVKWSKRRGALIPIEKTISLKVDGGRERPELGLRYIGKSGAPHYYRYFDLYYSKAPPVLTFKKVDTSVNHS